MSNPKVFESFRTADQPMSACPQTIRSIDDNFMNLMISFKTCDYCEPAFTKSKGNPPNTTQFCYIFPWLFPYFSHGTGDLMVRYHLGPGSTGRAAVGQAIAAAPAWCWAACVALLAAGQVLFLELESPMELQKMIE